MAKGKNSPITNSNKGGGSKAALRAEQEAAVKAVKAAEKSRRKAIAAEKLLKAKAANDAREAEREAAMKTDAADLLAGIAGEYKFAVHGTEVVDDMEVARTFDVRAEVFYHGDKPMFKLDGDQMGIPVAMLQYKTAENYQPLNNLPISLQNEMKNCFFYVYNAVKAAIHEAAAKRAAANASAKQQQSGNHFKSNNGSGANPQQGLSATERAAIMARNAKCGREAAVSIAAGQLGQYCLNGAVFTIIGDTESKVMRYVGSTTKVNELQGVKPGSFINLRLLKQAELPNMDHVSSSEIVGIQSKLHAFVHQFAKVNGVHPKQSGAKH